MAWCGGICLGYGKQKGAKIHSHIKCATVCIILMSLINHFYVGAKSKDGRANAVFQACSRGAESEREGDAVAEMGMGCHTRCSCSSS